jgi:RNA polymerase sigma-70 factor (ECF subfamily)
METTFKHFYRTHKDRLFGYLMRMAGDYSLASDVMQESFTRVLSNYGPDERSVSLLYTIARNTLFDVKRKQRWESGDVEPDRADVKNPEKDMIERESYRIVINAMDQLDDTDREILSLSVTQDFSYREIGGIVGISEGNVRIRIHRARLKLKEILGKAQGEHTP